MSQRVSSPRAAATATAEVSEPPRPSVVRRISGRAALEAGHDHDVVSLEGFADGVGIDGVNAGVAVGLVGDDGHLKTEKERLSRLRRAGAWKTAPQIPVRRW